MTSFARIVIGAEIVRPGITITILLTIDGFGVIELRRNPPGSEISSAKRSSWGTTASSRAASARAVPCGPFTMQGQGMHGRTGGSKGLQGGKTLRQIP